MKMNSDYLCLLNYTRIHFFSLTDRSERIVKTKNPITCFAMSKHVSAVGISDGSVQRIEHLDCSLSSVLPADNRTQKTSFDDIYPNRVSCIEIVEKPRERILICCHQNLKVSFLSFNKADSTEEPKSWELEIPPRQVIVDKFKKHAVILCSSQSESKLYYLSLMTKPQKANTELDQEIIKPINQEITEPIELPVQFDHNTKAEDTRIFRVSLEKLMENSKGQRMPAFLLKMFEFLNYESVWYEGITKNLPSEYYVVQGISMLTLYVKKPDFIFFRNSRGK